MQSSTPFELCHYYELPGSQLTQVPVTRCHERRICGNSEGNMVRSITSPQDSNKYNFNPGACESVGMRVLNPYRWALEACEPGCGHDVCREYGDRLAAYFECQSGGRRKCVAPRNPAHNGCHL